MNIPDKVQFYTTQYNTRADTAFVDLTLSRWAAQAKQARKTMACLLDLPYGESSAQRLDYFPTASSQAPLIVFIHGGWWRFLDKSDFSWVAHDYVKAGYNVAITNYDLCPHVSLKTIVQQQLKAIAYLYRQADGLDFNAHNMHVAGHSAGGHLASMMCCADWTVYNPTLPKKVVKSGVSISGICDLSPLSLISAAQADLKLTQQDMFELSPLSYAPNAPLLAWAGSQETEEFARQSHLLQSHWGSCNAHAGAKPNHLDMQRVALNHFTVVDDWASAQGAGHLASLQWIKYNSV